MYYKYVYSIFSETCHVYFNIVMYFNINGRKKFYVKVKHFMPAQCICMFQVFIITLNVYSDCIILKRY